MLFGSPLWDKKRASEPHVLNKRILPKVMAFTHEQVVKLEGCHEKKKVMFGSCPMTVWPVGLQHVILALVAPWSRSVNVLVVPIIYRDVVIESMGDLRVTEIIAPPSSGLSTTPSSGLSTTAVRVLQS